MYRIRLLTIITAIFVTACGEGIVNIDNQEFEPKVVIQGTLFPHQKVEKIKISRNFRLNTTINNDDIVIQNAQAAIIDENGTPYHLTLNSNTGYYEYTGTDLVIEYGESYTLEVNATIDGQVLFAKSTTTVPQAGFEILPAKSVLDSMVYRQRDASGELTYFEIVFTRSPGTDFYACSLRALDADTATFIYENPFGDLDVDDVLDDFDDFRRRWGWIQDTPLSPGESSYMIWWWSTWFYGNYQAIVYAGDKNFRDFLLTFTDVQEGDGNFHEPAFHIEGDGIGVFASAIADTVYFKVLRE